MQFYFALARYTTNGALDFSFGENGKVTTTFNNSYAVANAIALQGDKIVVAGCTSAYNNTDFALARYTTDGKLDSSFGVNGIVTTDFNTPNDYANAIAIQGDKIIAAGFTGNYPNTDFALARYTTNGALDSSFGVNGKVITQLAGSSSISALAVQANRLYAVGSLDSSTGESYGVVAAYQLEELSLLSAYQM